MNYRSLNTPKRLVSSKEAIQTVIDDPELSEPLAGKGYPAEELAIGLDLQNTAVQLYQTRFVDFGTGVDSTKTLNDLLRTIRGYVSTHRAAARRVFRNEPGLFEQLRLRGPLPGGRDQLLLQSRHFYTELASQPGALEKVAPFGLTADVVTARLQDVDALEEAMNAQQRRRAEAKTMTVRQNAAIAELDEWTIRFLGTVRLVFRKQQEQLDKLGL